MVKPVATTRQLILVRHSLPEVVPTAAPSEWHLSGKGRELAKALAWELSIHRPHFLFSSNEPKAFQTGEIIARETGIDNQVVPDLHEHAGCRTEDWVTGSEFRDRLSRFFRNPSKLVFGTETANDAHHRFVGAIDTIVARVSSGCAVVVSHGTVISLFTARAGELDPFEVWNRLTCPGFIRMRIPGFEILEEWRLPDS